MPPQSRRVLAACLGLVFAVFAIFANTLESPFVFDDTPSIVENPFIEHLWPLSQSFGAPPGAGSSGRPLVSFSLALNYALGGRDVLGYHLFNISVLALSALALFSLARRVLAQLYPDEKVLGAAFSIALLWSVHPLHTDTLNHVVYRNGAMMGLFYLLSLDCAMRCFSSRAGRGWSIACVVCAACSMACKEVAVSLPLAVVALDRQFGAGSILAALRKRWGLYLGLAATWGLLALFIVSGDRGASVGFEHAEIIDGVDYLRTQALGITRYLRLALLSEPFIFDYHSFPLVRAWSDVYFETALLGMGFLAAVIGVLRRSVFGLLGLSFFAILAPTSSVIPLAGELLGEHRMYLPLVPLVAMGVLVVWRIGGALFERTPALAACMVLLVAAVFAESSIRRNLDYASLVTLWQDTVEKMPRNDRAWNHLAIALKDEGRDDEAEAAYLRTLELRPKNGKASFNYGNLLFARGDKEGALKRFAAAARFRPKDELIRFNHGYLLCQLGRVPEGLAEYRATLQLRPDFERALMLLAWALATDRDPAVRDGDEAVLVARRLNKVSGNARPKHLDVLAAALAEAGDFTEAARVAQQALHLAQSEGQARLAEKIERRLVLYRGGQAFRE